MIDRYYTPTIEEFHVGFECEWRLKSLELHSDIYRYALDWQKHIITLRDFSDNEMSEEFHNITNTDIEFRVKYLSKQCFEELGFEILDETLKQWGNHYIRAKKKYKGGRKMEAYYSYVPNNNRGIYLKLRDSHYKGHFEVYIKNKSELKKLLELLKVID